MTDTLVEPPPPPTVRDDALARGAHPRATNKRRVIAIALAAPVILLGLVASALYLFLWRYEPVARRHIPGNANIVARVEIADVVIFGPVRRHLWPLFFEQASSGAPSPSKGPGPSRAERIREATGVNLAADVREVIIASVDATSWVVLLGGRIAKGRFVAGAERITREDGFVGWRMDGPLLVGPPGARFVLGQADDGTIALGTDKDIVTAALPATDEWQHMGLPLKGAVTFVATNDAWRGALGRTGSMLPATESMRSVERVTGQVTLGSSPSLDVHLYPPAGQDPAPLAGDIERSLAALRLLLLLAPDVAGEKEALASTKVTPSASEVVVTSLLSYDGLDRACQRLAAWIRPSSSLPSPSAAPEPPRPR